jgi:hypothetical protein
MKKKKIEETIEAPMLMNAVVYFNLMIFCMIIGV